MAPEMLLPDRDKPGRIVRRSPALQARREEFAANARPATSTVYDWTLSLAAPPLQLKAFDEAVGDLHDSIAIGNHEVWGDPLPARLQGRRADEKAPLRPADAHAIAADGVAGAGGPLPHAEAIQEAFGRHDIGHVEAHTGGDAARAAESLGAEAYATGDRVAFRSAPTLHTAAHEAAHVVQQRAGVSLEGGLGERGDRYERHADEVADAVVAGRSAEGILDRMVGGPASPRSHDRGQPVSGDAIQRVVQFDDKKTGKAKGGTSGGKSEKDPASFLPPDFTSKATAALRAGFEQWPLCDGVTAEVTLPSLDMPTITLVVDGGRPFPEALPRSFQGAPGTFGDLDMIKSQVIEQLTTQLGGDKGKEGVAEIAQALETRRTYVSPRPAEPKLDYTVRTYFLWEQRQERVAAAAEHSAKAIRDQWIPAFPKMSEEMRAKTLLREYTDIGTAVAQGALGLDSGVFISATSEKVVAEMDGAHQLIHRGVRHWFKAGESIPILDEHEATLDLVRLDAERTFKTAGELQAFIATLDGKGFFNALAALAVDAYGDIQPPSEEDWKAVAAAILTTKETIASYSATRKVVEPSARLALLGHAFQVASDAADLAGDYATSVEQWVFEKQQAAADLAVIAGRIASVASTVVFTFQATIISGFLVRQGCSLFFAELGAAAGAELIKGSATQGINAAMGGKFDRNAVMKDAAIAILAKASIAPLGVKFKADLEGLKSAAANGKAVDMVRMQQLELAVKVFDGADSAAEGLVADAIKFVANKDSVTAQDIALNVLINLGAKNLTNPAAKAWEAKHVKAE